MKSAVGLESSRALLILSIILLHIFHTVHGTSKEECVKFGHIFHQIQSANVHKDCRVPISGLPVCCAALMNHSVATGPDAGFFGLSMGEKGVGLSYSPPIHKSKTAAVAIVGRAARSNCNIHKHYVSSSLELEYLDMAKTIQKIPIPSGQKIGLDRRKALLDYVLSEEYISKANRLLLRVTAHMQQPSVAATADDFELLSRFEITRTCSSSNSEQLVESWIEWIEPLTITGRHPFGFDRCYQYIGGYKHLNDREPRKRANDVDYVLLQSGAALYNQTHSSIGNRIHQTTYSHSSSSGSSSNSNSNNNNNNIAASSSSSRKRMTAEEAHVEHIRQLMLANSGPPKHLLFDAGTSTFDSSLIWFTCGYSQRRVAFDRVYGWELTLLHPNDYWRRVPPNWKPYWHFQNVAVASDMAHGDNPLRYIKQIASERDFVSFKLDIDHSDTEMPLMMSLARDDALLALVDEFFFELHFRCEVMSSCGWSPTIPYESNGLILDRMHVMELFLDLRKRGVRAHFWP